MEERNEAFAAAIRKPITEPNGIVGYGEDCFRLGSLRSDGSHRWAYEIPYAEITQIEHKAVREIVRGKLRDGSEFDFRFSAVAINPAKGYRQGKGLRDALDKIAIAEGGSLRAVEQGEGEPDAAPNPGCMGCGSAVLAAGILTVATWVAVAKAVR